MPRQPRLALHVCAGAIAALSGLAIAMPDAPTDLAPAISSLRTAPMTVVSTIGKTREGRDIPLITLGDAARRDTNPAIFIVAGIHGDHWVGTDVALGLAQAIARDHADALRTTTVYIVPRVNLDAANAHSSNKALRASRSTTTTPVDTDKDRRVDEDGPEDLNRDGVISQMRVKNPPPHLKATHILDPDNEGLLREADASKNEVAQYAILTEGIDNDNDGKYNEDAPGANAMSGVDLDKNFPHLWPEHSDGAGRYALSESEAHALATFVLDRPNIDAVLVFGPHDTLVALPQAGKMDITGRAPLGIENADKAHFERISKSFKDATGMTASPDKDDAGAFWSWAYAQGGAWSFSTPVWVRPDQIMREGEKKDDQAEPNPNGNAEPRAAAAPEGPSNEELRVMIAEYQSATPERQAEMMADYNSLPPAVQARIMAMVQGQQPEQPSAPERPAAARPGRSAGTGGAGGAKKNESDDAKWLALAKERGEGFVEWTTFDHPQLGEVEIGGFVPGFQLNPPSEEVDRLVSEQATFVKSLIEELPRLTLDDAVVERVSDAVFRVSITARNGGKLPTASAIAVKSRAKQPLVLRLEGEEKSILAGDRVQRATSIPGGGHERFEWLVAGREGSNITVTVRSPQTGEKKINVALRATNKEGGR